MPYVEESVGLPRGTDLHSQVHNRIGRNFCSHSGSRRPERDNQRKFSPPRGRRKAPLRLNASENVTSARSQRHARPPQCRGASAAVRGGRGGSRRRSRAQALHLGKRDCIYAVLLRSGCDKNAHQGHSGASLATAVGQAQHADALIAAGCEAASKVRRLKTCQGKVQASKRAKIRKAKDQSRRNTPAVTRGVGVVYQRCGLGPEAGARECLHAPSLHLDSVLPSKAVFPNRYERTLRIFIAHESCLGTAQEPYR